MKRFIGLSVLPLVLLTMPAFATDKMKSPEHATQPAIEQSVEKTMTPPTIQTARTLTIGQYYGSPAQVLYTQGQAQLVEKNYPDAIRLFEQALQANANLVPAMQGLAIAQVNTNQLEPAMAKINQAIQIDPVYTPAYLTRAKIFDAQDKPAEALEGYLTFLSLAPTDSAAIDIQRRANELYEAQAPQLDASQKAYIDGLRTLAMEKPEQAVPQFKKYIEMQASAQPTPELLNAHQFLALALQQTNKPAEAIPVLEKLISVQPQNPVGYYYLSSTYEQVGKKENAKEAWANFAKYAPKSQALMVDTSIRTMTPALR